MMRNGLKFMAVGTIAAVAGLALGLNAAKGQAKGPLPTITQVVAHPMDDIEGQEVRIIRLDVPPRSESPAHSHPGHTFVYVTQGSITTQVGDSPAATFKVGEHWYEGPNSVHRSFVNPSETDPAQAIAFMVAPVGKPTTTLVHE